MVNNITNSIKYIGVDDNDLDLFESQYVIPQGISYNSYLIMDNKTVLIDSVDKRKTDFWIENLKRGLEGKVLDYFVISHMEPDHSGSIDAVLELYKDVTLILTDKAYLYLTQFSLKDVSQYKKIIVKENDVLKLDNHEFTFIMAPMVHWPEVMVTYEKKNKILFSADAFGKFGSLLNDDKNWACEARRYYFNIVGKYGAQVQTLLKKAQSLELKIIAPLHGPVLDENLEYYLNLYGIWSKYEAETKGVFIAYASIHGHTKIVAEKLNEILENKSQKTAISDLSRCDMAEAIEDAFRYDKIILCAASYDAGVFLPMLDFLNHLKYKNWQNKTVALVENGTWAPTANKTMMTILQDMKNIKIIDTKVTIKSSMKDSDFFNLNNLVEDLLNN